MKIIINALSARLGGGQTYLKNLLAHLPEHPGIEILIFAPAALQLPQDVRIRRCTTSWPTENPLLRTLWEKIALPLFLRNVQADVLFCPGGVVSARIGAHCKVVTMFRNMIPFDAAALKRIPFGLQTIRNIILKRVMLKSMRNADLTIFISEHARKVIEALTPVRKAVTIPHGISNAFRTYRQTVPRPQWLPAGEYLLYVSRFDVYKHHLELVTGYASLPIELRARYKLVLVGEADTALANEVRNFTQHTGLQDQIIITGPINYADLPAAYHHATANLFASSCENCPNILLEALGAGRPVLSSDVMPMPEFGRDAAVYFSPHSSDSIRQALAQTLSDESLRRRLADAAARRSEDFDWKKTSAATWQNIIEIASK